MLRQAQHFDLTAELTKSKNKNMKKLFLLAAVSMLTMANAAFAQFEGTIVYTMEMTGLSPEQQAQMAQMGMAASNDFTIYVKGDKSRGEFSMGPITQTTITNYKEKFQVSLRDFMGQKSMIRTNLETFNKDKGTVTIKYIDGETKTIAGYKCKKAEAVTKDAKNAKEFTTIVWYTEEFNPTASKDFSKFGDLKGYPMEFDMKAGNGQSMKMTVKTITKGSVADSKFEIPTTGYKVYASEEEATKDMMKNMQGGGSGSGQ